MSDLSNPISPERFTLALRDLPLSTLALKVAELRNSIAHLDYSNEQLKPFAYPSSASSEQPTSEETTTAGDPDCIDAIRENLVVIDRMNERIELVKAEVENRGHNWAEFSGLPNPSDPESTASALAKLIDETLENGVTPSEAGTNGDVELGTHNMGTSGGREANGVHGERRHPAWTDGTFQTGWISAGRVGMDSQGSGLERQGGRLGDEELRRQMEERMRALEGEDDEGGMHL
jgi:hypothetical protein